jgi:hypothetical protein
VSQKIVALKKIRRASRRAGFSLPRTARARSGRGQYGDPGLSDDLVDFQLRAGYASNLFGASPVAREFAKLVTSY